MSGILHTVPFDPPFCTPTNGVLHHNLGVILVLLHFSWEVFGVSMYIYMYVYTVCRLVHCRKPIIILLITGHPLFFSFHIPMIRPCVPCSMSFRTRGLRQPMPCARANTGLAIWKVSRAIFVLFVREFCLFL